MNPSTLMPPPIHILSLGAGVQSSTLSLMAAAGEITPMPTAAIFADTGDEPQSVYRWLDWLEKQLPFPVIRTHAKESLWHNTTTIHRNRKTGTPYFSNKVPVFVASSNGKLGKVYRGCTRDFKIWPILRQVRQLAGIKRGEKCIRVIQWIGISRDEAQRMKTSREAWCEHRWPLIELDMTRQKCLEWMKSKGYPQPPRSACVYCPYHSNAEWRRLKAEEPEEFAKAARFEIEIQAAHAGVPSPGKIRGVPFLHRSGLPLEQVDFRTDTERGQGLLAGFNGECEGMCGV